MIRELFVLIIDRTPSYNISNHEKKVVAVCLPTRLFFDKVDSRESLIYNQSFLFNVIAFICKDKIQI